MEVGPRRGRALRSERGEDAVRGDLDSAARRPGRRRGYGWRPGRLCGGLGPQDRRQAAAATAPTPRVASCAGSNGPTMSAQVAIAAAPLEDRTPSAISSRGYTGPCCRRRRAGGPGSSRRSSSARHRRRLRYGQVRGVRGRPSENVSIVAAYGWDSEGVSRRSPTVQVGGDHRPDRRPRPASWTSAVGTAGVAVASVVVVMAAPPGQVWMGTAPGRCGRAPWVVVLVRRCFGRCPTRPCGGRPRRCRSAGPGARGGTWCRPRRRGWTARSWPDRARASAPAYRP